VGKVRSRYFGGVLSCEIGYLDLIEMVFIAV